MLRGHHTRIGLEVSSYRQQLKPFTLLGKCERINNFLKWINMVWGGSFIWYHACCTNKKATDPGPHQGLGVWQRQTIPEAHWLASRA